MTSGVDRHRVGGRTSVLIAIVAGVVAALAGAEPTGTAAIDWLLVSIGVGAVVWASVSAPWWAPAAACGIAAVTAQSVPLTVIAGAGFVLGLAGGVRGDRREIRAVVAAIALNVLIRSDVEGFFGLSAIIGIGVALGLFVVGMWRRPRHVRRAAYVIVGGVAAIGLAAVLLAGFAAAPARSDLTRGAQQARQAIALLDTGDYEAAAARFADSSASFSAANRRVGGALAKPALVVPGVAQNLGAVSELAGAAGDATSAVAVALGEVDPASLRVVRGVIDTDAVRAMEQPLLEVQMALDELALTAGAVESPWLIGPIQDQLADLDDEIADNQPKLENAISAVQLAPQMLGADGERRYLLLFTSPAEARGITGFIGNYAEITIDDGAIEVVEFGRRSDLEDVVAADGASCPDLPEEMLARYGRFGLTNGVEGTASSRVWSNLTTPAHFPYVAEAASCLYPQSGGRSVDGVIALDPYVLAALMAYTGGIEVPELGVTVTADDAADFILREQYLLVGDGDQTERIDALDTLGQEVISRLLGGTLPEPAMLARDLGVLAGEDRLLVWTPDAGEQDLLQRLGMSGSLPMPEDGTGFAVFVGNAGESKIDVFLEREIDVRIETDDVGDRRLVADVALTNAAPSSGLPDYVIGNAFGLPNGSSRLNISFYGPAGLEVIEREGNSIPVSPQTEAGWFVFGVEGVIGSGETASYHLEFLLPPTTDDQELVEWCQPLAHREC